MSRFHRSEFDRLPELAFRKRGPFGRLATLEGGGGGSSAPAPDPRLVEAQIRSMGIQDDAIQEILGLAKRFQPLQEQQMQEGLDAAKQARTEAQSDREYALGRRGILSGLQDRVVSDAKSFDVDQRGDELAAQAVGDVRSQFAQAREATARALARAGINPSNGRFAATLMDSGVDEALAAAGAATKARSGARAEKYALTDRATNVLAGYPGMTMQATGAGVGYGTMGQQIANTGLGGMTAPIGQAATVAGQQGANAASMFGQQASYKNAQDRLALDDGGLMGFLGTLGGAAITKFSEPGLKADVELVGTDPRGFGLYEFRYLWSQRREIGVMANEIEEAIPDAVVRRGDVRMVDYSMIGEV